MNYRTLGRTGVKVSELCLGTMMFGEWGNTDHDECVRIIHAALDAGINFVDTADVYSQGESEEIVGKALKGRRDEVVLATKFHGPDGRGPQPSRAPRACGSSRRSRTSLRRLQTDHIDLYQMHRPDPDDRRRGDARRAHRPRQRQGKIRYVGLSTFPAVDDRRGALGGASGAASTRFSREQPPYSIFAAAHRGRPAPA